MFAILPNLYLASFNMAQQGVRGFETPPFVVNATKDFPMLSDRGLQIPVDDNGEVASMIGMSEALPVAVEAIHGELMAGRVVIVHCFAGIQRSATVIVAYLMAKYHYSMEEAIVFVREKKRDALFWTVNFRDSLEHFQRVLRDN
jgi:hypothetical protein